MAEKPVNHGRDHRPVGWLSDTDPGGSDPMAWLNADRNHIVFFNKDLQTDDFLYVGTTGPISIGNPNGIHLVADGGNLQIQQGLTDPGGANYSGITLFNSGTGDGTVFMDAEYVLSNVGTSFQVRDAGAVNTLFQIDANGTIHGKASVGSITWDL